MKKQIIFIVLIVFAGLIIAGSIGIVSFTAYKFSITMDGFNQMDEDKAIQINRADTFENKIRKFEDSSIEGKSLKYYEHTYRYEDIYFLSKVPEWTEDKLAELATELYANKHGEEIKYVSSVILYPSSGEPYIGTYHQEKEVFDIPVSLYDFFPEDAEFELHSKLSIIALYDADRKTTPEDMSAVLSHEYGHHFTEYHFGLSFSRDDKYIEYYKIRSQGTDSIQINYSTMEQYLKYHMWYLAEIAAEDYVYLMGSENAHRLVDFYDTKDKLRYYAENGEEALDTIDYYYKECRNGTPHENTVLALPNQVEGLAEFFYSFVEDALPTYTKIEPIGTLNLKMKKNGTQHLFTWDQPYTDADVVYTLIAYTEDDELMLIQKTTHGDEIARAYLGNYSMNRGSRRYSYSVNIEKGTVLKFRVSITFPDGTVVISDPIEVVY